VFYDLGHVSAFGVPAVGELIGRAILPRLREDAAPAGAAERGDLETAVQRRPASPP
jgi:hypothetical protein